MSSAQAHWLPEGRLHLHHGPIDLIIDIVGPRAAYAAAAARFDTILDEMVPELPELRKPACQVAQTKLTSVGLRMAEAAGRWSDVFVTPMAAVAGAVADEVLNAITKNPDVRKAVVNNGGDVAFHLAPGESITGLAALGQVQITHKDPSRGIATSGWRGRSRSLGIADAVTVAAVTAADADVAATLIANAVDLPDHPAIQRVPARDLAPDTDLGDRLVTTAVAELCPDEQHAALTRGQAVANQALQDGLIHGATLTLGDQTLVVQAPIVETNDA